MLDEDMANPKKTKAARPQPVRVPARRAAGLDEELTAQPRPLSDELGESDGGQAGLSVDPENLGVRFLSEATEQGEALPHPRMESELSPATGPDSDAVLTPPNFEHENTLWEQTVDLVTQTQNAADQLRGSPLITDDDDLLEEELEREVARELEREPHTEQEAAELRLPESDIRELSLFDREVDTDEGVISPEIDAEIKPHTQTAPSHGLGAQVEGSPERAPAAPGGDRFRRWSLRVARSMLLGLAAMLNRMATRLRSASEHA
jgi:hypothetical protein